MQPPKQLDGATVLKWAWSGTLPFGRVRERGGGEEIRIYGLAICAYAGSKDFYRFSCNRNWEVVQEDCCETVDAAIEQLPEPYKEVVADWHLL